MTMVDIKCLLNRPSGEALMLATYFPKGDLLKTVDILNLMRFCKSRQGNLLVRRAYSMLYLSVQ